MNHLRMAAMVCALLFTALTSFTQKKQVNQFEKNKGKLPFPVCNVYGVSDIRCARFGKIKDPFLNITFTTDSAAEVKAIYKGKVCGVYTFGKDYAVVTSFDNYYISYYPLVKPKVKKGDIITHGQPISKISSFDNPREINVLMSKESVFIDPYKWFRW